MTCSVFGAGLALISTLRTPLFVELYMRSVILVTATHIATSTTSLPVVGESRVASWGIWDVAHDLGGVLSASKISDTTDYDDAPVLIADALGSVSRSSDFYTLLPTILKYREALMMYKQNLAEKMNEMPGMLEKQRIKLESAIVRYTAVVNCDGVDISSVAIPEQIMTQFDGLYRKNVEAECDMFLQSLPRLTACWLIDQTIKKAEHKLRSKEISTGRFPKGMDLTHRLIREIDELFTCRDTPEAITLYSRKRTGLTADDIGMWIQAVGRHMEALARYNAIQAEVSLYRDVRRSWGRPLSLEDTDIQNEILRVMKLHYFEGIDIHLGTPDSLLMRVLVGLKNTKADVMLKNALWELSKDLGQLTNDEQTLSFAVLGDSPVGKYQWKTENLLA